MITIETAIKLFKKVHPELTVTAAANYKDCYLLNAVKNVSKTDYSDPFYVVKKETGAIGSFAPLADLDGFLDAIYNNEIPIK